jgi:Acetyltransferase (GNAT) domain
MEYEVKVIRSIQEVEELRSIWEKMQCHPNVDIDYYLTIVDSMADILQPHVILFYQNGQPQALAVGRLERKNMGITLGYKTLFQFKVPCLTILYGGLLGNWSQEISHLLVAELMNALKRNEAAVAWFNLLRSDTHIYEMARKEPSFVCRDHVIETNPHWKMTLPNNLNDFLQKMTSKHRYWLNRLPRVLEKDFPGKIAYKIYQNKIHLEKMFTDAEEVAKKTYQRNIDAGFVDNNIMRRRLAMSADRGWLRAYLLYVDEKPCAFWIGTLYGKVFHLDFTGYDTAYKHYEPGTILFMRMIEDLTNGKIEEIDFGFGDAFYKQRFGDQHWSESSVYIYAPTIKGILLNAIRTINLIPYRYLLRLAERTNILQKIKRLWRDKLIRNKNGTGNIK